MSENSINREEARYRPLLRKDVIKKRFFPGFPWRAPKERKRLEAVQKPVQPPKQRERERKQLTYRYMRYIFLIHQKYGPRWWLESIQEGIRWNQTAAPWFSRAGCLVGKSESNAHTQPVN